MEKKKFCNDSHEYVKKKGQRLGKQSDNVGTEMSGKWVVRWQDTEMMQKML